MKKLQLIEDTLHYFQCEHADEEVKKDVLALMKISIEIKKITNRMKERKGE